MLLHVQPGTFNWRCATVLFSKDDPYSDGAARAFSSAAAANQIEVCKEVQYGNETRKQKEPIKEAIREIMENRCCLVTVVFGQSSDLASILLEAHKQNYVGEWVMGDSIKISLGTIANDLKQHLDDPSSIHKLLRGMFQFILERTLVLLLQKYGTYIDTHFS